MNYETPLNLVRLLNGVVQDAAKTVFFAPALRNGSGIYSLEDFSRIPVTPLKTYRKQHLGDVLAKPSNVEWIVGPLKGQSTETIAVSEGADEAELRYDLFIDAVRECVSLDTLMTCAIITSATKRYFAAEIATILIRYGVPSHVFIDHGNSRTYERLHHTKPDLLVVLSNELAEEELPLSIQLCITFRASKRLLSFRQLDLYVVDELGFLGHSTDGKTFTLNKDVCYFERTGEGNLIVTPLYNRTQPMMRIQTLDKVKDLRRAAVEFIELSRDG